MPPGFTAVIPKKARRRAKSSAMATVDGKSRPSGSSSARAPESSPGSSGAGLSGRSSPSGSALSAVASAGSSTAERRKATDPRITRRNSGTGNPGAGLAGLQAGLAAAAAMPVVLGSVGPWAAGLGVPRTDKELDKYFGRLNHGSNNIRELMNSIFRAKIEVRMNGNSPPGFTLDTSTNHGGLSNEVKTLVRARIKIWVKAGVKTGKTLDGTQAKGFNIPGSGDVIFQERSKGKKTLDEVLETLEGLTISAVSAEVSPGAQSAPLRARTKSVYNIHR